MEADEVLFQIDTDKVTIDVRAPEAGRLEKILASSNTFCVPACVMEYMVECPP